MVRKLVRFDPWLGREVRRRGLVGDPALDGVHTKMPTTDVYTDSGDALIVEAHLPNFDERDVSVAVERGVLVIHAERRERDEDAERNYVLRESGSSFYRGVELPEPTDEGAISADFANGVLKVTVPFATGEPPRRIPVKGTFGPPRNAVRA